MRIVVAFALGAALLAAPTGVPAQTPTPVCHGTQQPRQIAELLFGRDIGRHIGVSETAWARFAAREITPRFPSGLTISEAKGQWREGSDGAVLREPSKRVEIVLPGNDDDEARLDAIVKAYKDQFRQHSVLVIVRSACVSF